jgi:hypothetical protein
MNTHFRLDCCKLPPPPINVASARDMTLPRSGTARDERNPSISAANTKSATSAP